MDSMIQEHAAEIPVGGKLEVTLYDKYCSDRAWRDAVGIDFDPQELRENNDDPNITPIARSKRKPREPIQISRTVYDLLGDGAFMVALHRSRYPFSVPLSILSGRDLGCRQKRQQKTIYRHLADVANPDSCPPETALQLPEQFRFPKGTKIVLVTGISYPAEGLLFLEMQWHDEWVSLDAITNDNHWWHQDTVFAVGAPR